MLHKLLRCHKTVSKFCQTEKARMEQHMLIEYFNPYPANVENIVSS